MTNTLYPFCRAATLACTVAIAAGVAHAAPPACPFKPEELSKVLGIKFAPGQEEPGMGGTSCKYVTLSKGAFDPTFWVLIIHPGANQDMLRQMTAGPKPQFEAVAGDPDGAARVVGSGDASSLVDVTYKRNGHVIFLRASGGYAPDAKDRAARQAALVAQLLKLPRLP